MKIRTKFYLGALISICLIIVLIIILIHATISVSKQNEHRAASRQTLQAVSELDILTYDYLMHHEVRPQKQWHLIYNSLGRSLKELTKNNDDDKEVNLTNQLSKHYKIIGNSFSEIESGYAKRQKLISENAPHENIDNSTHRENRLVAQLLIASQSMVSNASILAEKDVKDLLNTIAMGVDLSLLLTLILLTVTTFIVFSITKTVTKSLDLLRKGADEIGSGNLDYKIDVKSKDEIGIVANVLNRMAANLKKVTASKSRLKIEIAHRKKVEETLRNSENYIKSIINAIPQQVFVTDPQGNEIYSNEIRRTFFKSTEAVVKYKEWETYLYPEDKDRVSKTLQESIKSGLKFETEYRMKNNQTGKYQWFLVRAVPIKDDKQVITSWFGTATNIDEQRKLQEKKDEFMSMASHELKTPLTSLKAYAQLVLKGLGDEHTQNKLLTENINRQVDKLNELVQNLLDVRKIESGKFEYNMSEFDIKALIDTVVNDFQYTTNTHRIEKTGLKNSLVLGDAEKIGQVLINLLTNAVKYSPKADKVIVRMDIPGNDKIITISVEDFGLGIDKKDLDKIFDRLYRVSEKSNKKISGFGLGLHISSEIIKKHGSKLQVKSIKDKGSIFSFTLPLIQGKEGLQNSSTFKGNSGH